MDSTFPRTVSYFYKTTSLPLNREHMQPEHKKILKILLLVSFCMFGFTFALIPLYTVFCKVTGLNGKVDIKRPGAFVRYKNSDLENSRLITVEFDVNRNRHLNCEFSPEHTALQIKTGELTLTSYYVKNLTNRTLIIQAIPSITPGIAAKYLKKLECFCFNKQTLKPQESMHLPLRFWLEPEIPDSVKRLTLSYTLFDVTEM